MKHLFKYNFLTLATIVLICVLPFYVLLQVFFKFKLGIPYFGLLLKEGLLFLMVIALIIKYTKENILPKIDILDITILLYIVYGIGITLYHGLGLDNIFYGGRYDFIFLITFMIFKHAKPFIEISNKKILQILLLSTSASLFVSIFVKFLIGESALILFGFSEYSSDWTYNGSIPTHHGLENSGMKRFQGILDGPSAMAYFLILYAAIFVEAQKKKNQFHIYLVLCILFILVIITFSRSAILGIAGGIGLLFLLNIKTIYQNYRRPFLYSLLAGISILFLSLVVFQERIYNTIIRPSSTAGHFSRMEIGYERFTAVPFGQGLATSGPGFRNIFEGPITKIVEEYYIPESWFVQQLVEGGFIYFTLFILIFLLMSMKIYKKSKSLFVALIAVLIMNIFLHIFEATYLSVLLFLVIGITLSQTIKKNELK